METNNRVGKFSASRISELLAGGTGKTAQSYCLDLAMEMIGIKKDLQTSDMLHGIVNQLNAFELCVKPLHPNINWHDEYMAIDDRCGASPDFIGVGIVGDIKCPTSIYTYLEQIEKMPTKYYNQLQMQMMSANVKDAMLCFYLTKKEEWGEDEWSEYPMPLEDRFKIFDVQKDEETCDKIMTAVDKYQPEKNILAEKLANAPVMDEVEFFYSQMQGMRYKNLKEASNIFTAADKIIKVNNKFFYTK